MSGNILRLFHSPPVRPRVSGWRPNDLAEFYRIVALLARNGLAVSLQTGVSDEGDPWAVILRDDTGDVLAHLARVDGQFVVASAAGPPARRGRDLRAVVDAAMADGAMAPVVARRGEGILLHPATVFAAFIVTAWMHTEAPQGQDEPPEQVNPDQRAAQQQALAAPATRVAGAIEASLGPACSALVQAATALLAVSSWVVTQAEVRDPLPLQVDPDTFVQAALAYEQGDFAMMLDAAENLAVNELGTVPQRAGSFAVAEVFSVVLASSSTEKQATHPICHAPTDLPDGIATSLLPGALAVPSKQQVNLVLAAEVDVERAAPAQRAQATLPSVDAPAQAGRMSPDPALLNAGSVSVVSDPADSSYEKGQISHLGPIYEAAARILHLLPVLPDSAVKYALPVADAPSVMSGPGEASGLVGSGATPPMVEPQREPAANHRNAQILLDFMADQARVVDDLDIPWEILLAGASEAREALIFDAGWLAGRSFMLMPGVLMVEDDLLGETTRDAADFQAASVSLNLGDGLSVKLLGIVDIPSF